jgi:MFS family permease
MEKISLKHSLLRPRAMTKARPDTGYAWIIVAASFAVHFAALGVTYIFGVYQQAYRDDDTFSDISNVGISLIGSLTSAGVPLFAIPSGRMVDQYGHRLVGLCGGIGIMISLILASLSKQYWQLLLTQGLLLGMSVSFAYFPALTIISQWFEEKQGLATGIAVAGSGIGGLVLGPVTRAMISSYGKDKALLITGIFSGLIVIIASLILRPRFEPATKSADYIILLKNPKFRLLYSMSLIGTFGYMVPFFYLPSYAVQYGMTKAQGALLLGILNGSSAVGRIVLGQLSDKVGHINSLFVCLAGSSLSMLVIWPFAVAFNSLMAYSVVFGLSVGGYISIFPTVITNLFGTENIGGIIGLFYSAAFVGTIAGPQIASAIIDSMTTIVGNTKTIDYIPAMMYAGGCMFLSGGFLVVIRSIQTKGRLFMKI